MTAPTPPTPSTPTPIPALLLAFDRGGQDAWQRCAIPRGGLVLGQGTPVFDHPFDDPAMAPRHAEVRREDGRAVLSDLGAGRATRLNGEALSGPRSLSEGDVVRLGDTLMLYTNRKAATPGPGALADDEAELTGSTPSIVAVRRSAAAVAPHARSVVVSGETGTGKELVARLLHRYSGRPGPFVAVNCGGFTEGLLASELFGHVRGAFTGAVSDQQGLFRAARGGTLLLDEAGDLPLALQATLLRVLEMWQIRPVGSCHDVPVDVRVVVATNVELAGLIQRGLFRADLYARLAQWTIRLPALRDRREDIPALTRALLRRLGAGDRALTTDLAEALLVHPWPLNVRGLSNVLSIATIATPPGLPLGLGPEVMAALLDNRMAADAAPAEAEAEIGHDRASLELLCQRFEGRVAEMARHAGVSRPKMYRLLWAVELDPATYRKA
jgi:DNA-binding NtrC family response regulator